MRMKCPLTKRAGTTRRAESRFVFLAVTIDPDQIGGRCAQAAFMAGQSDYQPRREEMLDALLS
jgi:hypothetical protein